MSLSLLASDALGFLVIVPMALEHCFCASVIDIGVVGLRICRILIFMCIEVWSLLSAVFGYSLLFVLHSFLSLASRHLCPIIALDIGGRRCIGIDFYGLGGCIDQTFVYISWSSWIPITTWAPAKSCWSLSYVYSTGDFSVVTMCVLCWPCLRRCRAGIFLLGFKDGEYARWVASFGRACSGVFVF